MIEKITLALAFLMFTGLVTLAFRRFRQASPVFWFPIFLCLMALGTIPLLDVRSGVDMLYIFLFMLALAAFIVPAAIYLSSFRVSEALTLFARRNAVHDDRTTRTIILGVFVISVAITILYYVLVGYNIIFTLLVGGQIEDYSTMRLAAYSGDQYLAPGYVNQFKNVLLPVSTICIAIWLRDMDRKLFWLFLAIAGPFLLLALAGTGQRAFLAYTAAASAFAFVLHQIGRPTRVSPFQVAVIGLPLVVIFVLMTTAYYESSNRSLGTVLLEIVSRFTMIQQEGGLIGFRYIHMMDTAWFSEWGRSIFGILPGQEGSRVAHEVHAIMYGSDRGTVPLSSVGSAFHNGSWIGVLFLFGLMGWVYADAYRRYLSGPRTVARSVTYGFMFFYFSIYIADSPVTLIDNGVVAVSLLLLLIARMPRRQPDAVRSMSSQAMFSRSARLSRTGPNEFEREDAGS
jgi:oligosaccharide repeat unit polymerase